MALKRKPRAIHGPYRWPAIVGRLVADMPIVECDFCHREVDEDQTYLVTGNVTGRSFVCCERDIDLGARRGFAAEQFEQQPLRRGLVGARTS